LVESIASLFMFGYFGLRFGFRVHIVVGAHYSTL
jgi:hypothetical protein